MGEGSGGACVLECEGESCAAERALVECEVCFVGVCDFGCDGEAEAGSAVGGGPRFVGASESFEDLVFAASGYAVTVVVDVQAHRAVNALDPDGYDAGCVACSIIRQDRDDTAEFVGVTSDLASGATNGSWIDPAGCTPF